MLAGAEIPWSPPACNNKNQGVLERFYQRLSTSRTAQRSGDRQEVTIRDTFALLDGRSYTLQATAIPRGTVSTGYVVRLMNAGGTILGTVDRYECSNGVAGSFERAFDALLMEQAIEKVTGEVVAVKKL